MYLDRNTGVQIHKMAAPPQFQSTRSIPDLITVLPIQGVDQPGLAKALRSVVLVYHLRVSM